MRDFNYYAPTEVAFGEQSEEQVALLVKKYGGLKVLKAEDMEKIYKIHN